MLLLVIMYMKKTSGGKDRRNFESVRALFVFCPGVTTLDLRYDFAIVLHSFSANQKRIIFSCTLLIKLFIYNTLTQTPFG